MSRNPYQTLTRTKVSVTVSQAGGEEDQEEGGHRIISSSGERTTHSGPTLGIYDVMLTFPFQFHPRLGTVKWQSQGD